VRSMCFDHGRARRVKWNPLGGCMAVLCGDGNVYVVQPTDGGNGEIGMFTNYVGWLT
jgi:transcription factor C subunit 6